MRSSRCLVLCALLAISLCALSPSEAATPKPIFLSIQDRLRPDGTSYFDLSADVWFTIPGSRVQQLIAPSGSLFPIGTFDSIRFESFSELTAAIVGGWQFKTAPSSDPLNFEHYDFNVSSFELDDATVQRPQILEPVNPYVGADTTFQIIWDPPSSSYGAGSAGLFFDSELIEPGVLEVQLRSSVGSSDGYFRFSTSMSQSLPSFISAAMPSSSDPTYDVLTRLIYTRSVQKTFYPRLVPEPHALVLLITGALSTLATGRSRAPDGVAV